MHNLDMCEVTVLGEELNQEQESLEIDMTRLQQKGIEMSSSNLGMIITGGGSCCCSWEALKGLTQGADLERWFVTPYSTCFIFLEFQAWTTFRIPSTAILRKAVILENTAF